MPSLEWLDSAKSSRTNLAVEPILPEGELVPRAEESAAGDAVEAADVVDLVPRPHHVVRLRELLTALTALRTEESEDNQVLEEPFLLTLVALMPANGQSLGLPFFCIASLACLATCTSFFQPCFAVP